MWSLGCPWPWSRCRNHWPTRSWPGFRPSTACSPSLLAALFVSSPYLQTGPVALTALLTFGALSTLAPPGSPEYIQLAALLALLVGILRVGLGLIRMGRVAYLLSEPVLTGFTTGAAILIVSSQLPKVFDVAPAGNGVLEDAASALSDPGAWSGTAMLFAAGALVAMFGGRRLHRLFPGVLLAVVVGVLVSTGADYSGSRVGDLDGGFLSLTWDFPWSDAGQLMIPAIAIALVGFAEPSSIARTFAAEERQPWDANKEMVSQGVANLAAGVSGAFPVGGSFSRSSLNRLAGATSAWAGAITGLFVLAALPLAPLIEELPRAILGAIVIGAVAQLINVKELVRILRASQAQSLVALGTLLATLVASPRVERGVLVGIGLALMVHLYRELSVTAPSHRSGDTLTVSPTGVLWFASVPQVERLIRLELAAHEEVTHVVIDLSGVGRLDWTASAALARIVADVSSTGARVELVNVRPGAERAVRIHLSAYEKRHGD